MKKFLFATTLAVAMLFPSISTMAEPIDKDTGYISVTRSTTKEVAPNQAEISIGIKTSDKSLQKASADNKVIASKVYSSLKSLLGPDDFLKTGNYTAKPEYIYTKDNKRVFDKYTVTNTVTVKTKKIELVSKLIDTAIAQGATNVDNLQFSASNNDNICNDLLAELTKSAYIQATTVAKSINSQILGIKSINATCNPENNSRPYYAMMKSSNDETSATPIEGGKIRIYANVDASFFVK